MKACLIFTACIAASLAAPAAWTPEMGAVYSETSLAILKARANGLSNLPSCDLSKVNITAYLATIPDAPTMKDPGNTQLVQVTIGRGVQNYTCADSTNGTKPVQLGAVANLYNVSCIAANYPEILSLLPPFAVQYNSSLDSVGHLMWTKFPRAGHHFFNAAGTPVFDLDDNKNDQLGILIADGKNPDTKVSAPSSAVKGQVLAANGQTGAVPWLKLNAANGTTDNLATVYRVDTAGGSPPTTCEGQPSLISVEYAAQYWFFKSA